VNSIDLVVFRWINGWPDWFGPFFIFLSEGNKLWPVRIVLLGFLVFCLWRKEFRLPAILAVLGWPIANEVCDLLKNGLMWTRPSVDLADTVVRVNRLTSFGTASAHSANMMAVAVPFLVHWRPVGFVWLGVAVFTGISRVYVGVHYPGQVLFGWFVGAAVSSLLVFGWREFVRRRAARAEDIEA
jgi:undecaprenyl-diphosphatase